MKGASHFCAAGGRKSNNDECAAVEIMRANSELIISGTANGRGTATKYELQIINFFVGAVEGLKIYFRSKYLAGKAPLPSSVPKKSKFDFYPAPMPPTLTAAKLRIIKIVLLLFRV